MSRTIQNVLPPGYPSKDILDPRLFSKNLFEEAKNEPIMVPLTTAGRPHLTQGDSAVDDCSNDRSKSQGTLSTGTVDKKPSLKSTSTRIMDHGLSDKDSVGNNKSVSESHKPGEFAYPASTRKTEKVLHNDDHNVKGQSPTKGKPITVSPKDLCNGAGLEARIKARHEDGIWTCTGCVSNTAPMQGVRCQKCSARKKGPAHGNLDQAEYGSQGGASMEDAGGSEASSSSHPKSSESVIVASTHKVIAGRVTKKKATNSMWDKGLESHKWLIMGIVAACCRVEGNIMNFATTGEGKVELKDPDVPAPIVVEATELCNGHKDKATKCRQKSRKLSFGAKQRCMSTQIKSHKWLAMDTDAKGGLVLVDNGRCGRGRDLVNFVFTFFDASWPSRFPFADPHFSHGRGVPEWIRSPVRTPDRTPEVVTLNPGLISHYKTSAGALWHLASALCSLRWEPGFGEGTGRGQRGSVKKWGKGSTKSFCRLLIHDEERKERSANNRGRFFPGAQDVIPPGNFVSISPILAGRKKYPWPVAHSLIIPLVLSALRICPREEGTPLYLHPPHDQPRFIQGANSAGHRKSHTVSDATPLINAASEYALPTSISLDPPSESHFSPLAAFPNPLAPHTSAPSQSFPQLSPSDGAPSHATISHSYRFRSTSDHDKSGPNHDHGYFIGDKSVLTSDNAIPIDLQLMDMDDILNEAPSNDGLGNGLHNPIVASPMKRVSSSQRAIDSALDNSTPSIGTGGQFSALNARLGASEQGDYFNSYSNSKFPTNTAHTRQGHSIPGDFKTSAGYNANSAVQNNTGTIQATPVTSQGVDGSNIGPQNEDVNPDPRVLKSIYEKYVSRFRHVVPSTFVDHEVEIGITDSGERKERNSESSLPSLAVVPTAKASTKTSSFLDGQAITIRYVDVPIVAPTTRRPTPATKLCTKPIVITRGVTKDCSFFVWQPGTSTCIRHLNNKMTRLRMDLIRWRRERGLFACTGCYKFGDITPKLCEGCRQKGVVQREARRVQAQAKKAHESQNESQHKSQEEDSQEVHQQAVQQALAMFLGQDRPLHEQNQAQEGRAPDTSAVATGFGQGMTVVGQPIVPSHALDQDSSLTSQVIAPTYLHNAQGGLLVAGDRTHKILFGQVPPQSVPHHGPHCRRLYMSGALQVHSQRLKYTLNEALHPGGGNMNIKFTITSTEERNNRSVSACAAAGLTPRRTACTISFLEHEAPVFKAPPLGFRLLFTFAEWHDPNSLNEPRNLRSGSPKWVPVFRPASDTGPVDETKISHVAQNNIKMFLRTTLQKIGHPFTS
ncbi:hypothetical protein B0T20DRAFT_392435 [Sordaria brevicollis]|uniref:Uncharacterized protein n=1 Tax=Sordaria brevicollis TaxID=83679 RepID=A0AAE0PGI8_SORBR|nr:hypothetical protein B0T20DRAFT_392435 [Sordaria brevicollis]